MTATFRRVLGTLVVTAILVSSMSLEGQPTRPAFEVASIKRNLDGRLAPGEMSSWSGKGGVFSVIKITVMAAVVYAYDLKPYQVVGGPDWIRNDRFTISARAEKDVPDAQIKLMLQSLLEDRFKLVTHAEQRDMSFRALVVARADGRLGPYMRRMGEPCTREASAEVRKQFPARVNDPDAQSGMMSGTCVALDRFTTMLGIDSEVPVLDRTGLTGKFTYDVRYAAGAGPLSGEFMDALEDQLGLKLKGDRGPIRVMVVDSVEPPSEN
jgi:uncharacterized protein (TIGR03435 family)